VPAPAGLRASQGAAPWSTCRLNSAPALPLCLIRECLSSQVPWRRRHSQVETGSLGAQPLPRVSHPNPALLGFATSKPPIALPLLLRSWSTSRRPASASFTTRRSSRRTCSGTRYSSLTLTLTRTRTRTRTLAVALTLTLTLTLALTPTLSRHEMFFFRDRNCDRWVEQGKR